MKQSVLKSLFQINRMMLDVTKNVTPVISTIKINVISYNQPLEALARLSLIC